MGGTYDFRNNYAAKVCMGAGIASGRLIYFNDNKSAGHFRYTLPHHDFVVLDKGVLSQGVLTRMRAGLNLRDFSILQ